MKVYIKIPFLLKLRLVVSTVLVMIVVWGVGMLIVSRPIVGKLNIGETIAVCLKPQILTNISNSQINTRVTNLSDAALQEIRAATSPGEIVQATLSDVIRQMDSIEDHRVVGRIAYKEMTETAKRTEETILLLLLALTSIFLRLKQKYGKYKFVVATFDASQILNVPPIMGTEQKVEELKYSQ